MYLSHLSLAPAAVYSAPIQAALSRGAYGHHQLLCKLFDSKRAGEFQFRRLENETGMNFLTLSRQEPQMELKEVWTARIKPFRPKLRAGQRLAFSVRINPTVNRSGGPRGPEGRRKTRKRRDLVFEAIREERERTGRTPNRIEVAQRVGEQWLSSRFSDAGFELDKAPNPAGPDRIIVSCDGFRQHRVRKSGHDITVSMLDCTGVGTVSDPELFRSLLDRGLGPAKGFGCGLVLIRPV